MRSALLALGGAMLVLAAATGARAAEDGTQLFQNNCAVCHQSGGVGVPGQFPRLAGRANVIAASPQGRAYLAHLVLNGMSGSVMVDGQRIIGVMPGFGQLGDADIAAVLTYVSRLQAKPGARPAPFTAKEIAAARQGPRPSAADMNALRTRLAGSGVIP